MKPAGARLPRAVATALLCVVAAWLVGQLVPSMFLLLTISGLCSERSPSSCQLLVQVVPAVLVVVCLWPLMLGVRRLTPLLPPTSAPIPAAFGLFLAAAALHGLVAAQSPTVAAGRMGPQDFAGVLRWAPAILGGAVAFGWLAWGRVERL